MHPDPEGTRKKSSKTSNQNSLRLHVDNPYDLYLTCKHTLTMHPASIAEYTISQVVPHFIRLFHNPDEASTRLGTLTLLCEVIEAARNSARQNPRDPALLPFKDEVLGLYISSLQSASLRTIAFSGLKCLVLTDGLLTDEEFGYVVHKVNEVITVNQEDPDERFAILSAPPWLADSCLYYSEAVLGLLNKIAERAPSHLTDQTLPLLFASLPENPPGLEALADRERCWRILSILRKLCIQQALFEVMVVRLLAKFDYLCFSSGAYGDDLEPAQAYSYMILKTLAETLRTKINRKNVDVVKYIDSLVPHIFNVFVVSAFNAGDRKVVAADSRLVKVAGDIITSVVQSLPDSSVSRPLS